MDNARLFRQKLSRGSGRRKWQDPVEAVHPTARRAIQVTRETFQTQVPPAANNSKS